MIKILCYVFLVSSYIWAAQVFSLSHEEYESYKKNPDVMLKVFENKFLKKTTSELPIGTPERILENTISDSITIDETNYKILFDEVSNKLKFATLRQTKSLQSLVQKLETLLKYKGVNYDMEEVSNVLKLINVGKMSPFEGNIYLGQIIKLIKD